MLFVDFSVMAIPTSVTRYFIVVLVCISLVSSDVEHLFICLLPVCMSLEKCLFSSDAQFLIGLFFTVIVIVVELYELFVYFGN